MEYFRRHAHRFVNGLGADRHHHIFLKVDFVVGMLAAVNDVRHRYRHLQRMCTAQVAVQR